MRALTMVLPHFCNLGMLQEQQKIWMSYRPDLRAQLHVVVVDDCSPKGSRPSTKMLWAEGLGSIQLFRLLDKKRWNWLACRNLGAEMATTDWLLLTDIDHALPEATLARLVCGELDTRDAYRFQRVTASTTWPYDPAAQPAYKPHNDTWFLTKQTFFSPAVGGYDERLSGCYGTSGEFRDRLVRAVRATMVLPVPIIRYPREVLADASTLPSVYTRKGDPKNDKDLERRKAERAMIKDWKPLHGLTPWERIQ